MADLCGLGALDPHGLRGGLHQGGDVDGVAEHGEVRHLGAHHASHAGAGVDAHPHLHLVVPHVGHLEPTYLLHRMVFMFVPRGRWLDWHKVLNQVKHIFYFKLKRPCF